MHTLYDFITHVKGIEYIVSVLFIAGYILYWEALKPKPFKTLADTGRDDLNHIRDMGSDGVMKTVGRIAAAPFIGLAYVIMLPFSFFYALMLAVVGAFFNLGGRSVSFGWRPTEAYLAGKKAEKKPKEKETPEEGGE